MADKRDKVKKFLKRKQYSKNINTMGELYPEKKSLFIDYEELETYDDGLADALIQNPDGILNIFVNTSTGNSSRSFTSTSTISFPENPLPDTYNPEKISRFG